MDASTPSKAMITTIVVKSSPTTEGGVRRGTWSFTKTTTTTTTDTFHASYLEPPSYNDVDDDDDDDGDDDDDDDYVPPGELFPDKRNNARRRHKRKRRSSRIQELRTAQCHQQEVVIDLTTDLDDSPPTPPKDVPLIDLTSDVDDDEEEEKGEAVTKLHYEEHNDHDNEHDDEDNDNRNDETGDNFNKNVSSDGGRCANYHHQECMMDAEQYSHYYDSTPTATLHPLGSVVQQQAATAGELIVTNVAIAENSTAFTTMDSNDLNPTVGDSIISTTTFDDARANPIDSSDPTNVLDDLEHDPIVDMNSAIDDIPVTMADNLMAVLAVNPTTVDNSMTVEHNSTTTTTGADVPMGDLNSTVADSAAPSVTPNSNPTTSTTATASSSSSTGSTRWSYDSRHGSRLQRGIRPRRASLWETYGSAFLTQKPQTARTPPSQVAKELLPLSPAPIPQPQPKPAPQPTPQSQPVVAATRVNPKSSDKPQQQQQQKQQKKQQPASTTPPPKDNNKSPERRNLRSKSSEKQIDDRRTLWSSICITTNNQSDPDGAGCVAQVPIAKGTRFVDRKCQYHPGEPPNPVDLAGRALTVRGSYVKTGEGFFYLIPSLTEWINEATEKKPPKALNPDEGNDTTSATKSPDASCCGKEARAKKRRNPSVQLDNNEDESANKPPNISFQIDYDNKDGTPLLAWKIIRKISQGDELLVQYHSTKHVIIDLTATPENHARPTPKLRKFNYVPQPKVECNNLALLDTKMDERRKFVTSVKVVSGAELQCDARGAGVVAQRDVSPSEKFQDFFCPFHFGQLSDQPAMMATTTTHKRDAYIQASNGYFVLDNCWSEWINEAEHPGQVPNMTFQIAMEEPSPLNAFQTTPILEWYITRPIATGQELLVKSYLDPIKDCRGNEPPAIYILGSNE